MIEMPTTRGLTILIDDEDAELVAGLSWFAVKTKGRYYAHARLRGQPQWRLLMHRLIMGAPRGSHVHHRNGNGLDNQRSNLELLTPSQHRSEHVKDTRGVYFDRSQEKFRASVRVDGQPFNLGLHADEAVACRAVWIARQLLPELTLAERRETARRIKEAAHHEAEHE